MIDIRTPASAKIRKAASLAFLLAATLLPWGCQRAGDGVGLDATGQRLPLCQAQPEHPSCVAVDPCLANPNLPQCKPDTCKTTPPAPGCAVDLCKTNPSAPGCTVDVCKTNPNDPSCAADKVKFDKVLAILLSDAAKCSQCHLPGGAGASTGKLLLSADSAYANLVNARVATASIAQKGWVRVKPGSPDSSYLYLKIAMASPKLPDGTVIGARMPMYNNAMDTGSINLIKRWILDGAEK